MNRTASEGIRIPEKAWIEDFRVRGYQADPCGRLSILTLCQFLQEAAANHARRLGVGIDVLNGRNRTWMLSRLRLRVKRLPAAGDTVAVHTWPSGRDRLFALRDFVALSDDGDMLASADSAWLVVDRERRRPVRLEPILENLRPEEGLPVLEKPIPAVPEPEVSEQGRRFEVRYRDLDGNRHVNNVSYVEWILEAFFPEFFVDRILSLLEVDFRAEALAGDTVFSRCRALAGDPEAFLHGVFRESDGRESARARTVWEKSERL